ncbi:hypothetical protein [Shivajiella indica]|uniref:Outer membrane protein beta-barrel domain-containing protein n=1 Tax=Shivajiella indica TaxID=872115 RepID=A0ABW5B499_9BACT
MKKYIICFLAFLAFSNSQAQEKGDVRYQFGGDYKLSIDYFGAHAGIEYLFIDKFSLAPNFTFWFPPVGRSSNLNMDLRYYLTSGSSQLYVMGGYSNFWINTQPGMAGETVSRPGGNFGIGANLRISGNWGINTEFKVQSQNTRQPVLRIGLVFGLGN